MFQTSVEEYRKKIMAEEKEKIVKNMIFQTLSDDQIIQFTNIKAAHLKKIRKENETYTSDTEQNAVFLNSAPQRPNKKNTKQEILEDIKTTMLSALENCRQDAINEEKVLVTFNMMNKDIADDMIIKCTGIPLKWLKIFHNASPIMFTPHPLVKIYNQKKKQKQ